MQHNGLQQQIESVLVSELAYDPRNVRKHGRPNLDAIKLSLTRFGQQKPLVVDVDGLVVAGNGTLEAARELGWEKADCDQAQ